MVGIKKYIDKYMKNFKEFVNEAQVRFSPEKYLKTGLSLSEVTMFNGFDPSQTKSYTDWIIKSYLKCKNKKVFKEDLSKVKEYLINYEKYKKKNLIDKDIYKFSDYKELYQKMKEIGGFGEPTSDESYLIDDRYYIKNDEADVYYEDEHYLIVIPRTYKASKFYADKTQWCTRFPEQYENYSSKSDLHIIIDKKLLNTSDVNRLMQYQENSEDNGYDNDDKRCFNFMNIDDVEVRSDITMKFIKIFKSVDSSFLLKYDGCSRTKYGKYIVMYDSGIHKSYRDQFLNYKVGVVDKNGEIIIPIEYNSIRDVMGYFIVTKCTLTNDPHTGRNIWEKNGLFDHKGKELYPCRYDSIDALQVYSAFLLKKFGEDDILHDFED